MDKVKLYNGNYIDKRYFDNTLGELIKEKWIRKGISELGYDHVNCMLSFETISNNTKKYFYESDKGNRRGVQ